MILSDTSIERPVFATVISLILVVFGLLSFDRLSLREYPDIDPPIISITTDYPGANADIIETRITQVIEDRISGIEGIKIINSTSQDGRSAINIEFDLSQDIDAAANDIRDRVSRIVDNLPEEADPPEIFKEDSNSDVIMWLNLASNNLSALELTDYAERYLVDPLSVVDGVARVRIGAARHYAMRIWLDRKKMAALGVVSDDVEQALRRDNVELPAGRIESVDREFTLRIERAYQTAEDFSILPIRKNADGFVIRLKDIANVELGAEDYRNEMYGNGEPMIGLGIIKQSQANLLEVARKVKAEVAELNKILPQGVFIHQSYDESLFVEAAIKEVYLTLSIAAILVILVIWAFLGNIRAMLIPAFTVPVSLIASFIFLYSAGFSINILSLLALILAIGLVVDDAIVMLENIYRRIEQGEHPLIAAFYGARQVAFAIIATTLVLISVFVPIIFLSGDSGRLFSEFALAMAAAVAFSSLIALTLSPMLCSKWLRAKAGVKQGDIADKSLLDKILDKIRALYRNALEFTLKIRWAFLALALAAMVACYFMINNIAAEYAPREDRGVFLVIANGPEGASFDYMTNEMKKIEKDLLPLLEQYPTGEEQNGNNQFAEGTGEAIRVLIRTPRSFGNSDIVNNGIGIIVLAPWEERERDGFEIINAMRAKLGKHPDVRAFAIMPQGLGGGFSKPVQFVLQGDNYTELTEWRDIMMAEIRKNEGLVGVDYDYKETKPQFLIRIDKKRASDLNVSIQQIGRTLETMLSERRVTTYINDGQEYEVMLEGIDEQFVNPLDLENIYVRQEQASNGNAEPQLIPLSNLVNLVEHADAASKKRYNRMRAITIEANLAPGYNLSEALTFLEKTAQENLPERARYDYKGSSLDYKESGGSVIMVFALAVLVAFLVMAAQFESFIHPFVILFTVPVAIFGGLLGLLIFDQTINIYSQIAMIMLIGLSAKNGILIVEFINQMRDEGKEFYDAIIEASMIRLRPILMTAITTVAGSIPLMIGDGAGNETRMVIGVMIFCGVGIGSLLTLFIVPAIYAIFARHTNSPGHIRRKRLELDKKSSAV